MKRFIHTYVLLFFCLLFLSCDKEEPLNNDNYLYPEMGEWFNYLCSPELGGRYSGSDGIKKAEKYICDIIGRSDSLTCVSFQTSKCEMTNITYHVEGNNDSLIVVGAHYDAFGFKDKTPLPGADDNLSGVAVLLKTIKAFQLDAISPYYSMDFCFFDGEEIGRYGSNHYVANCSRGIKLYINIDTCGNPDLELSLDFSANCSYFASEFANMQSQFKMRMGEYNPIGYTTDCEPFETRKIPFVSIGAVVIPYYLHSLNDNVSNISFSRLEDISNFLFKYLKSK